MEETERKKLVSGSFAVCIYLAAFMVLLFVCSLFYGSIAGGILLLLKENPENSDSLWVLFVMEIALLLAVLTSVAVLLRMEQRGFSELGLSVKGRAADIGYGMLMALSIYAIGFGLCLVTGEVEVAGVHFSLLSLIASWGFYLLVALAEEIMARGYLLGMMLRHNVNRFLALFISSLLFSLLHMFNPNFGLLPMINLVLAGSLLGASFLYTRNLWFPISLHLFWNWLQGPVLGYQVSGNEREGILALHLPQETVWNGGSFGFEGSLICTVLMILGTAVIVLWGEKRLLLRHTRHA